MNALIVDGEDLYRLSMREVVAVAGNFNQIYEAGSEHEFLSRAADHSDISLIILHPDTLKKGSDNCLKLVQRLYKNASILAITCGKKTSHASANAALWNSIHTVDRASSVTEMVKAVRTAMNLPTEGFGAVSETPAAPAIREMLDGQYSQTTPAQQASTQSAHNNIYDQELQSTVDIARLSYRQSQILVMAADGLPNKEIAARIGIAEGTVKAHMHAIFKVMGVSNRTQAVIKYTASLRANKPNNKYNDSIAVGNVRKSEPCSTDAQPSQHFNSIGNNISSRRFGNTTTWASNTAAF